MGSGRYVSSVCLDKERGFNGPVVLIDERDGRYWAYLRDREGIGIASTPNGALRLLANQLRVMAAEIEWHADDGDAIGD